jgi:hypothetical protein
VTISMSPGYWIIAAGIAALTVWAARECRAWLRPRHGRHEQREHAGGAEADAFIAALRGREPADERLADTDVRRQFWQPPASPPAPAAIDVNPAIAGNDGAGAGAPSWAQDPARVVLPRTMPPLEPLPAAVPRVVPDVPAAVTPAGAALTRTRLAAIMAEEWLRSPLPEGDCDPDWSGIIPRIVTVVPDAVRDDPPPRRRRTRLAVRT